MNKIEPFTLSEYNKLAGKQKAAIDNLYELVVGDRLSDRWTTISKKISGYFTMPNHTRYRIIFSTAISP